MTTLVSCGLLLTILLSVTAWLMIRIENGQSNATVLLPLFLITFLPYVIAVWRAQKMDWRSIRGVVVALAIVARLTFLPVPFVLSNDVYRYHWEGTVQSAGFNPYRHAPDAPELAHLRDSSWEKTSHRDTPSAYPPVLLLIFRLGASVSSGAWIFKLIFGGFDIAAMWFIVQLLRSRGQNESHALIWAWSPLVILEFAGMGHEMSASICFFVAGLWLLTRVSSSTENAVKSVMAAAAFAVSVLAQFFVLPLVIAVVAAARIKDARFWIVFFVLCVGAFVPFADAGSHLFTGLLHFGARWQFNASLFDLLRAALDHQPPRHLLDGVWLSHPVTKAVVATILLGVIAWVCRRRYEPARAAYAATAAMLLLSSTVHPWYVTWMVALVCAKFSLSWLVFSALVTISYGAKLIGLQTGFWLEPNTLRVMEYAPLFALLCAEWRPKRFDTPHRSR